jgi:hydrogenase expression/formation protein HypE
LKDTQCPLQTGKLPPEILARILSAAPVQDERLLVGPGIGLDCAVIDNGPSLLVFKSDPITFTSDEIGWYAVQVNANDIATSGAIPSWFLMTLLLPEGSSTSRLVDEISQQVFTACRQIGVSVIGGHSEITAAVNQPVIVGTMIGEVEQERLVTARGAKPEDVLLLTKGVPIEAVSILAREFHKPLSKSLTSVQLEEARNYLYQPGISVLEDARIAARAGKVNAMHDPTEGGLAAALWELAIACGHDLVVDLQRVMVNPLAAQICALLEIDPLASIASGALLLACPPDQREIICQALASANIACSAIGTVRQGKGKVWIDREGKLDLLPYPQRDEVARLIGQS